MISVNHILCSTHVSDQGVVVTNINGSVMGFDEPTNNVTLEVGTVRFPEGAVDIRKNSALFDERVRVGSLDFPGGRKFCDGREIVIMSSEPSTSVVDSVELVADSDTSRKG